MYPRLKLKPPAPRVIKAREIMPLLAATSFPPGTPINVMRMLLGHMNGVNQGNSINADYTTTPAVREEPQ